MHQSTPDDELLFETARVALKNCFSLVGTTACFDEVLLLLHRFLGLTDLFYQRQNQSSQRLQIDHISDDVRSLIEDNNQADIQLYQFVDKRLQDLIANYLTTEEISGFRSKNDKNHHWFPQT
ncbi:MAG: hypothetical protein DWP95_03385 [Proteobacteria bacterium]|nr:MAG: hypothetical protein DWP95_03385 [Pseudomonadota bacterium]